MCEAQHDASRIAARSSKPIATMTAVPISMGSTKVRAPKDMAPRRLAAKSSRSSSRPATNMRYSRPTVPSVAISPSRSTRPRTVGPTAVPDRMSATMLGRRSRSASIGTSRMSAMSSANSQPASVNGISGR